MTMISAIASSSRCSAPCKPCKPSSASPSYKVKRKKSIEDERKQSFEVDKRFDIDGAKHISEKDREAFLSYGLFNIVAGKRTAELLEKHHRHEHDEPQGRRGSCTSRRCSEPEILRHSAKHEFLLTPPRRENFFEKHQTPKEMYSSQKHLLDVRPASSEKRSLKKAVKSKSKNLQEFFKKL
ncbi:uncharacterized protein LOC143082941 [Mytilus galloprovincialis]|uniref:Uncharacterized protein n=1 Tax=Mytilus galloprovincialis TaxID=29158 RepID=A0A8B6HCI7_MYTGA|nr:Hypothetical predicted protein [Mytilus galloprovincialis]